MGTQGIKAEWVGQIMKGNTCSVKISRERTEYKKLILTVT
jgi:hypothetical protein